MFRLNHRRIKEAHSGFALVATLSMMVMLSVLAVGMLELSKVTLRNTSHDKLQAEARANARMALMVAIGRLQELAGDDRRVTAAADIQMDEASEHGSRYWTGVWSNAAGDAAGEEIYTKTPEAQFEGWLVSGADEDPENSDSTSISLDTSVTLVGAGTAGSVVREHVSVPLVEVVSAVPNMTGRYAWWVGDEGVKARGNLPSSGDSDVAATDLTLGQRGGGWEVLDGMENYPERGAENEAVLSRVFTLQSMSVAVPAVSETMPKHFHEFTVDSCGLLTDTLHGGLRMDLTPYLENGFPASAASASFPNAPVAGKNMIPSSVAPNILGPKWDRLRALKTMRPPVGGNLTVTVGNGSEQPDIAPILLDVRLLLGTKILSVPAQPNMFIPYPCAKISVALANPYPYPLRWTQNLELEFYLASGNGSTTLWNPNATPPATHRKRFLPRKNVSEPSVLGGAVFTIPPGVLAAGEAQAYTQIGAVNRPNTVSTVTVPLGAFLSSSPLDYRNSIILENPAVFTAPHDLEIIEEQNTSVLGIELRGGASISVLRRIEGLEINNANARYTRRRINAAQITTMTEPFPIQLYSFSLSQPGMDYGSLLPTTDQLGVRNSTLRTFMDFNLRAQNFPRPIAGYLTPPYFMETMNSTAGLPFVAPGGDTGSAFSKNLALSPLRWGYSSTSGPRKTVLFSAPKQIVSLAQFQHADLTADDRFRSVSIQPGNAFGNSYAPHLVKRRLSMETRYDYTIRGSTVAPLATPNRYYDMSYLLNASLWDSFFISTIPTTGDITPQNLRIREMLPGVPPEDMRNPLLAASNLCIEGSFNINSTSKDAWKALLASNRNLKHPVEPSTISDAVMFPRSLDQTGVAQLPKPSGNDNDSLNGFRRINDEQLDALAEEIARQVRLRGPFVSLSHFVNRALVDLTDDDNYLGRSGALQSAIDNSGLNMLPGDDSDSGFANVMPTNDRLVLHTYADGRPAPDMDNLADTFRLATHASITNASGDSGPPVWASMSQDGNPGNTASMLSDREMLTDTNYVKEQGFRSTGIPAWLTQADVLQVIGPVISARSDTFRIRTYGEVLDVSGKVAAQAWCEAIVQRIPEYLDSSDPSETRPAELKPINAKFGRRFLVASVRWLNSNEI